MAIQSWTDDPIVSRTTLIKATHFDELQDAINAWETAYGIGNTGWTYDEMAAGDFIYALSAQEMQDALDALKQLVDAADFVWTRRPAAGDFITGAPATGDVDEIRTAMEYLQDNNCYLCHSCDTESCTCNASCHADACDQCDASCHGYSACSCDSACYNDVCDTCNSTCYGYSSCSSCNTSCYGYCCTTCNSTCYQYYV